MRLARILYAEAKPRKTANVYVNQERRCSNASHARTANRPKAESGVSSGPAPSLLGLERDDPASPTECHGVFLFWIDAIRLSVLGLEPAPLPGIGSPTVVRTLRGYDRKRRCNGEMA